MNASCLNASCLMHATQEEQQSEERDRESESERNKRERELLLLEKEAVERELEHARGAAGVVQEAMEGVRNDLSHVQSELAITQVFFGEGQNREIHVSTKRIYVTATHCNYM